MPRTPILLAAAWAAVNSLWYAADFNRSYRAESAWIIFGVTLVIAAALKAARGQSDDPVSEDSGRAGSWPGLAAFVAAALVLYGQALSIGLLSDDFVLLLRARSGSLADTSWEYLRPLPLAMWRGLAALEPIVDVPLALHTLNAGLHGVNAWLTLKFALQLGVSSQLALLGAILFLAFPSAVETVAWASGIFDVLLTTMILTACLAVNRSVNGANWIVLALPAALAVFTKESGVMMPAFLAVAMWSTPRFAWRRGLVPLAVTAGVVVVYLAIRLAGGFAGAPPVQDLSGYAIKEIVSRPFGTLGLPFHSGVLAAHPWIPFLFALAWPALFAFGAFRWTRIEARQSLGLAGWIMLSVAPLATMLFIGSDLQGSRWMYAGSVAWCLLIVVMLRGLHPRAQLAIVTPLVALYAAANFAHQSNWVDAGKERDRVLAAYRASGLNCVPQQAQGVPDNVGGAYVFRNGFPEAVAEWLPSANDAAPCSVIWDGNHFSIFSPR